MKMLSTAFLILIVITSSAEQRLRADELPPPQGEALLVIHGNIVHTNRAASAHLDRAMLEALPGRIATLQTPWTRGIVSFEGPFLGAVLDFVGAEGSKLVIRALNGYSAEIPLSDAYDFDTILALKKNDKYMSVREKGPIFLIYPFDKNSNLYNEKYFVRSVWQIKEIEVVR